MELVLQLQQADEALIQQAQSEAEQQNMRLDDFLLHLIRTGLQIFQQPIQPELTVQDADTLSGLVETLYLLRSPANAEQLQASIAEFETGHYNIRSMIDDDRLD